MHGSPRVQEAADRVQDLPLWCNGNPTANRLRAMLRGRVRDAAVRRGARRLQAGHEGVQLKRIKGTATCGLERASGGWKIG